MSDLLCFELDGIPCAIDLTRVARIRVAEEPDLDLARELGLSRGERPADGLHRGRSLQLEAGGRPLRIAGSLRFESRERFRADVVPALARAHPWVAAVLLGEGAPVLELSPEPCDPRSTEDERP